MNMRWIKALDRKQLEKRDYQFIKVGDRIKIYGKETIVEGFYFGYNEGTEKWETIIKTTDRGDPLERSLSSIEICEDSFQYESSPSPLKDVIEEMEHRFDVFNKLSLGEHEKGYCQALEYFIPKLKQIGEGSDDIKAAYERADKLYESHIVEPLKKEVERLKELLQRVVTREYSEVRQTKKNKEEVWNKFKTENNIL